MEDHPDCAVVIPAYNAERYLEETVRSAFACPLVAEVIVVNDGSTDGTADLLRDLCSRHPALTVVTQPNAGLPAARNSGFLRVRFPFVCFLDADDRLLAEGFAALHRRLGEEADAGAVFGAVRYIDSSSRPVTRGNRRHPERPVRLEDVLSENFIDTIGAILFRSDAVRAAGMFDPSLRFAEDWEFYTRFTLNDVFLPSPQPSIEYRLHEASMMHGKSVGPATFAQARDKVFSTDGPIARRLSPKLLRRLEYRNRAAVLRVLLRRRSELRHRARLLGQLGHVALRSRGDAWVMKLLVRTVLSVGRRVMTGR